MRVDLQCLDGRSTISIFSHKRLSVLVNKMSESGVRRSMDVIDQKADVTSRKTQICSTLFVAFFPNILTFDIHFSSLLKLGYKDFLQSPLQYQRAVGKALLDRVPDEKASSVTTVLMVVEAGRGPLAGVAALVQKRPMVP
ncbi:hypothetical protein RND81_13G051500 [Saponaria officinalis]|uniref:PRMT5 arginine-N-methyltransferase domain-containing protein n=1 Tax=Saponaria officinalis TaxID=3572 RepID=A0AAW1H0L5_SAPOF